MTTIPVKCDGQRFLTFGNYSTDEVLRELQEYKEDIWKRYDFRTKFESFKHAGDTVAQSTHQNTYTLPIYWLLNTWRPHMPLIVYRFTECNSLFHWADYIYGILINQGVEDGIIVKAMFAKLLPDRSIPRHVDLSPTLQLAHRYHWVISSDQSVQFTINGESKHWPNGDIFELNNVLPHSVRNPSDTERIHFIMDIMPYKHIMANTRYIDVTPESYASLENTFISQ